MNRIRMFRAAITLFLISSATFLSALPARAEPTEIRQIIGASGDGMNPLSEPLGIAVDGFGDVYITTFGSNNVFKISPGGEAMQIIDATGDGVSPLDKAFSVAVDGRGNAYVVGRFSHNVFKIARDGTITEILDQFAGDGFGGNAFGAPFDIVSDAVGNVYVTGEFSHNAFRIAPSGAITQIIDATGDGLGNALSFPTGIAIDAAGNVYIASAGDATRSVSDKVFKITPGGGISVLVDFADPGRNPSHLAVDPSGNLFVVVDGMRVLKIAPGGAVSEVFASADAGVNTAVDGVGNLYVSSEVADKVFRVAPDGLTTVWIDAGGDGTNILDLPSAVAADTAGNVFVTGGLSNNVFHAFCPDDDGDGLCNRWETSGLDFDLDGIRDLDLPNIAGPGIGTDPNHKDLFLELDWTTGQQPTQAAIYSMKTAFALAPVDAGGTMNPDGLPGINIWVDTGTLVDPNGIEDATSATPGSCNDGIDNGRDGTSDTNDPDCRVADDLTREDGAGSCSDGVDNDDNGSIDAADPSCENRGNEFGAEAGSCSDGLDNDLDGVKDNADSDCKRGGNALWDPAGNERGGIPDGTCSDGLDNEPDGRADALDANCLFVDNGQIRGLGSTFYAFKHGTESLIPSEDGAGPGTCRDGVDNGGGDEDGDGKIELDDSDPDCRPTCFNGVDDDGDGLVDAADLNCQAGGNFDRLSRRLVFRYMVSAGPRGAGGQGELGGNDVVEKNHDGGTIMHEFGHNLGLDHGGGDGVNRKPNYISVMDYDEQFCIFGRNAVGISCLFPRRLVDYSPARYGGNEGASVGLRVCYDGVDNDGDGMIDADDPDCRFGIRRAAAPLDTLDETILDESVMLDITNRGHSLLFTNATDVRVLWNADGDVDGDGISDGIDWNGSGPPPPFIDMAQQVDVNRDGICVCSGSDFFLSPLTIAAGDDVQVATGPFNCRPSIRAGVDRTCNTTAGPGDVQSRNVGFVEPNSLTGFDDWSAITLNLRLNRDQPDGGMDLVEEPELTLDEMLEQVAEVLGTDLAVASSANPSPVEVGMDLVYRLSVENNGPNIATQVQLVDTLATRVIYQSDTGSCSEAAGIVTCDLGEMAASTNKEIEITVDTTNVCVAGVPATIVNNVSVADIGDISVLPNPDRDSSNNVASLTVTPVDTIAPELALSVTPESLWPPNNKFVDVVVTLEASDICDSDLIIRLLSITSNEPTHPGVGKGEDDIRGADFGTDDREFQLRAARLGQGDGRVYTIAYEAEDGSGNKTTRELEVTVTHDMR